MLACRQHGDHGVGAFYGCDRTFGNACAIGHGLIARGSDEVERDNLVTCFHEIGSHRAAHVAEANECDRCHFDFLRVSRFSASC